MKKYKHLTKEQRYTISVCLKKKISLSAIAKLIDVSKSTVSREIKRNSNMYRHYVAIDAQQFSDLRKHIPRRPRRMTKGLWEGDCAAPQETPVPEDHYRRDAPQRQGLCVCGVDIPYCHRTRNAAVRCTHTCLTISSTDDGR